MRAERVLSVAKRITDKQIDSKPVTYDVLLREALSLVNRFGRVTLQFYWSLGSFVDKAIKLGKGVDDFAHDLRQQADYRVDASALYKTHKIFRKISEDDLKTLINNGVSYTDAILMSANNVTPVQRQRIIAQLEAGNIDSKDIKSIIVPHKNASQVNPVNKYVTVLKNRLNVTRSRLIFEIMSVISDIDKDEELFGEVLTINELKIRLKDSIKV